MIHIKQIINTEKAPLAIGPYSQGTTGGGMVFVSGQLPIDPESGGFAQGGIKEQTRQSLTNLQSILHEAGTDLNRVLKTTVFLSDMENFSQMNDVYQDFFKEGCYPARSAIEVARLPKDALIEIEAIALA